ncbi:MAG: hypothetical protein LBU38_02290 [Propionibacteriaceae bacterium]|jgi:hypothetical protein|nr:hypothetical protein [Propionibacteriaceae bacterium]
MRTKLPVLVVALLSVLVSALLVAVVPVPREIHSSAGIAEQVQLQPGLTVKVKPVAITQQICPSSSTEPCSANSSNRSTEETFLVIEVERAATQIITSGTIKLEVLSQGKSFGTKDTVLPPPVGFTTKGVVVFLMPGRFLEGARLQVKITGVLSGYYRVVKYDLGLTPATIAELGIKLYQPLQDRTEVNR